MFRVQSITEDSPLLEPVKQLWRRHSDTLGFLPSGAFDDYARCRHILVATRDNHLAGYVLYRVGKTYVTVAHFCVAQAYRGQGVSRLMLNDLRIRTQGCSGILLNCRRDFDANQMWPRLGFRVIGNIPGKASEGSELVQWLLHYGKPDLLSLVERSNAMDIAMDANITFHLIDGTDEESQGLNADWLRTQIRLCYTQELCNEIDRHRNQQYKKKRRGQIQQFTMLPFTPDAYDSAERVLRPLFSHLNSQQSESDFRQLVCSLAGEADAFVTLDGGLLSRSEEIFQACGLPVVRPAEMIGRIDVIEREREYQRNFIGGTRQVSVQRVPRVDDRLISAIKMPQEQSRKLVSTISRHLANPHRAECRTLTNPTGEVLASYVVDRDGGRDTVPVLRICAKRMAGTLARAVLTTIARDALAADSHSVFICDASISDVVRSACIELGYLPIEGGLIKVVVRGWHTIAETAGLVVAEGESIDELRALLPTARTDVQIAAQLEHLIWPGKLSDACLPSFVVPIQPQFAEHLFDSKLAANGLFGAEVDLALNPESAYYRAAKPKVLTCPSRILWYVSDNRLYHGSMAIRACSRMVELVVGPPKVLHSRFRRLGVYEWSHVLATAEQDLNRNIMAFRFDDTEIIDRVPLPDIKKVLEANGIGDNNMVGPFAISAGAFGELYTVPLDQTSLR